MEECVCVCVLDLGTNGLMNDCSELYLFVSMGDSVQNYFLTVFSVSLPTTNSTTILMKVMSVKVIAWKNTTAVSGSYYCLDSHLYH